MDNMDYDNTDSVTDLYNAPLRKESRESGDMNVCPECGGLIVRSEKNELFCSRCGLVVGYFDPTLPPPVPHRYGSTIHNITKSDYRYLSSGEIAKIKVLYYLNHYLDGRPRHVKMRAENLALKILRLNVFTGSPEAIALACAYAAGEENNIKLDIRKLPKSLRKTARKVLRYLKKMQLYRIQSPRDRVEKQLRLLCEKSGFDFEKCRELYYRYEKKLSRFSSSSAASIVGLVYSSMHDKPFHIEGDKSKLRKISREILQEEYLRLKNPERGPQ